MADISSKMYCSRSTYTKIGTIQRRLAWPLRKDDTQIREAFPYFIFFISTLFKLFLCFFLERGPLVVIPL